MIILSASSSSASDRVNDILSLINHSDIKYIKPPVIMHKNTYAAYLSLLSLLSWIDSIFPSISTFSGD